MTAISGLASTCGHSLSKSTKRKISRKTTLHNLGIPLPSPVRRGKLIP
jgi:hypothetical protein